MKKTFRNITFSKVFVMLLLLTIYGFIVFKICSKNDRANITQSDIIDSKQMNIRDSLFDLRMKYIDSFDVENSAYKKLSEMLFLPPSTLKEVKSNRKIFPVMKHHVERQEFYSKKHSETTEKYCDIILTTNTK